MMRGFGQRGKMEKNTLRRQLGIVSMIGYAAVVVALIVFDYYFIYEDIRRFEDSNTRILTAYVNAVDEAVEKVNNVALGIYNENADFQVLSYSGDETENYLRTYQLLTLLEDQMQTNHELSGVLVFYEQREKRRYTFRETITSSMRQEILEQSEKRLNNQNTLREQFLIRTEGHVFYAQMLTRKMATIVCVTDLMELQQDSVKQEEQMDFILTYGQLVLNHQEMADRLQITGSDTECRQDSLLTGKERIYKGTCNRENLAVFLIVGENAVLSLRKHIWILLFVTILVIVFVVIVYRFLRQQILKPLKSLADTMIAIGAGEHLGKMEQIAPYIEFGQVTDAFNGMMAEIEQLKINSYEEQIAKQRAQMQCFRLQLSPHFYLNCLKTLNFMAIEKETENMQELILAISAHLRYLLKNEAELVTVREEIENVKSYVHLQQLISSRNVECSIHIEPELMECRIPILCIQTFVENTFKHAVLRDGEKIVKVAVRGIVLHIEGKRMMDFSVVDNGKGYSEEVLRIINTKEDCMDEAGAAIGIRNVKQRCSLLYGERAEYMFYNMQGAVSELVLPLEGEETENEYIGD